MEIKKVSSSYKDPDGFVFTSNGEFYRCLKANSIKNIEEFLNSDIFEMLINNNKLVRSSLVKNNFFYNEDLINEEDIIMHHEKLQNITKPYEWSFNQLKDAAIFHLNLEIELLKKNFCLKDASAKNIVFKNNKPILIDLLSIRKYEDGNFWMGQMQFYREFLNPLILKSKLNINFNSWYKGEPDGIKSEDIAKLLSIYDLLTPSLFIHVFLVAKLKNTKKSINLKSYRYSKNKYIFILKSLKKIIQNLSLKKKNHLEWSNYSNFLPYQRDDFKKKEFLVKKFLNHDFKTVIDLGCNDGHFTFMAKNTSVVYGLDSNHDCIDFCYLKSKEKNNNFIFKIRDISNLIIDENNRDNKIFDASICLALIHHLRITSNIPLDMIVNYIARISRRGLVEFINKDDEKCSELIKLKGDYYQDYNKENFLRLLEINNLSVVNLDYIKSKKRFIVEFKNLNFLTD